jgi:tRNA(Ile)-lysidine synthase
LAALAERLAGDAPVTATLAGASVVAAGDSVEILREPGEAGRGGLAPIRLAPGAVAVWDGRFELQAGAEPLEVRALGGASAALAKAEREALRAWPSRARRGLPLIESPTSAGSLLEPPFGVMVRDLVAERLRAACGMIEREDD